MLWKIVIVFLCAMVLVGMIGKLLFPNSRLGLAPRAKCGRCGRPRIGRGPCPCAKDKA